MLDDAGQCFTKFDFCQILSNIVKQFPSLMNNVWFVWTAYKTLLDSCMCTRQRANSVPESLLFMLFYKTCFMLLNSFGHPIKHHPTLFHKTRLDDDYDVLCFTHLDGPLPKIMIYE